MNAVMLELYKQAQVPCTAIDPSNNMPYETTRFSADKFYELIVQECMSMCNEAGNKYFNAQLNTDNFYEKNIHSAGRMACENLKEQIASYFGVEK